MVAPGESVSDSLRTRPSGLATGWLRHRPIGLSIMTEAAFLGTEFIALATFVFGAR
jgi:hypothetical protein